MDEKENTRELVVVDVKHYKKVKKALHESEERYRQLFENVPIGIYRTTADGRIVDANPALVKMLGYESFTELSSRNLEKEYLNQGYPRLDFIKRLERDGEIKGLEEVWYKKDGSPIHVRENTKLIKTAEGQVLFEGTVEDITANKQIEEAQKIRTQQLEILNRIICSGNLAESMVEMLEKILDCVIESLAFDTGSINMYNPETKKVNLLAKRGKAGQFFLSSKCMAIDNMPFPQVLRHGQSVFVEDLRRSLPDIAKKWGWQMACSIPLVSKGMVVGAMNVASCSRSVFSPEEKSILDLIGKEAGTLISKLQTETALRKSEKFHRTLIDTSPDIITVVDLKGNLVMINQRFLQISGYFYDEVIGHNVLEFVPEMKLNFMLAEIKKFLKKKKLGQVECAIKKKNGKLFPMEMTIALLTDEKGKPSGLMGVGRDISERKRSETALRESEEKFRTITEKTSDLIAITDAKGFITYASSSSRSLFQYKPQEMCGHNFTEFIDASSVSKALAAFQIALERNEKTINLELTMKRKDGSLFIGEVNGSNFYYGNQFGSLVIIHDIDQRKRNEEQLRFLSSITENISEAIIVTDANFVITYINKVGEQLFGYTLNELKGKTPKIFNAGPNARQIQQKSFEIVASGKMHLGESLNKRKDGSIFLCEYKVVPLKDEAGRIYGYSSVQRDISERKEAENKLLAYQEQLRALTSELTLVEERERRRIASELHDQIGQNLALCKLKVAALEKNLGDDAIKGELAVIRRLLECSIQDARSLIFDLSPPVLYELGFAAALEWLAERIQEQFRIPVEFESRFRDPELKNDQQVILFQVVRELLINVGKHSRASQAKIILSHDGPSLKIQVNDDGVGFDASRIFTHKEQNNGFGFFSMRERLNYLGGGLEVKSKPGQGSQIILTVPQLGSVAEPKKENS